MTQPLTDQQLDDINARAAYLFQNGIEGAEFDQLTHKDVPALLADLRRARARIAELEGPLCGRTRDISGTEYGPCVRRVGHREAYCRSVGGGSYFLAVDSDQLASPVSGASGGPVSASETVPGPIPPATPETPPQARTAVPATTEETSR